MAVVGRGGTLYQVVWIDDHCDSCGVEGHRQLGICFGYKRPVLCFHCLKGAGDVAALWPKLPAPDDPPLHTSSGSRSR